MSFLPPPTNFSSLMTPPASPYPPYMVQRKKGPLANIDVQRLNEDEFREGKRREHTCTFGYNWIVPMGRNTTRAEDESEEESAAQEETPLQGTTTLAPAEGNGEGEFEGDLDGSIENMDNQNSDAEYD